MSNLHDKFDDMVKDRDWIDGIMKSLFSFRGRINRTSFWKRIAFLFASGVVIGGAIDWTIGWDNFNASNEFGFPEILVTIVCWVWFLSSVWIGLATGVKRLHDRGRSGWWLLIPIVSFVIFWVGCGFIEGDSDANRYGPVPK